MEPLVEQTVTIAEDDWSCVRVRYYGTGVTISVFHQGFTNPTANAVWLSNAELDTLLETRARLRAEAIARLPQADRDAAR